MVFAKIPEISFFGIRIRMTPPFKKKKKNGFLLFKPNIGFQDLGMCAIESSLNFTNDVLF